MVGNSEEEHWRTTCSLEMVTLTGGHLKDQKEWRLETHWNAGSHTLSMVADEECCGSKCCKKSPVALSNRTLRGVRFQLYSSV